MTFGKAGGLLGEPLKGADKTHSSLRATGFLLLPPRRGKVGMGVKVLIVLMLSFYPHPNPPLPWGVSEASGPNDAEFYDNF
jgi:hypothetical protein